MSSVIEIEPEKTIELDYGVRFNKELSGGQKLFLAEIQSLCKKGKCPYHASKLAQIFNVSSVSIANWVKKLCDMGYLEMGVYQEDSRMKFFLKMKEEKPK